MMLPPGFLTQWTLRICQAWRRQIILWKTQESLNRDNICSILKREEKNKLGIGVFDFCLQCDMWSDQNDDFKWKLQLGKVKVLLLEKKLELIEFWRIVEAMCSVQGCVLDLDQTKQGQVDPMPSNFIFKIKDWDKDQWRGPLSNIRTREEDKTKDKWKNSKSKSRINLAEVIKVLLLRNSRWRKNWQFDKLQILFLGACSWLDRISFSFHLGWQIYIITTDKTLQNV